MPSTSQVRFFVECYVQWDLLVFIISFRMIAHGGNEKLQARLCEVENSSAIVATWNDIQKLWDCHINEVDFSAYSKNVSKEVLLSQARASFAVVRYSFLQVLEVNLDESGKTVPSGDRRKILLDSLFGIMLAGMIEPLKEEALGLLEARSSLVPMDALISSLSTFVSLAPFGSERVAKEILSQVVASNHSENQQNILGLFLASLCEGYGNASWSKHGAFQTSILFLIDSMDQTMLQKLELKLVNSSFVALKSVPRELAAKGVEAAMFAIRLCKRLYCPSAVYDEKIIWDGVLIGGDGDRDSIRDLEPNVLPEACFRPNDEAFKIIIQSIASMQHLVR